MTYAVRTKPTDEQIAGYVQNIIDVWNDATPEQKETGRNWYPQAHAFAAQLGDVHTSAGVIAALSAQKAWELNVKLARDAFEGNVHGQTSDNLDKVMSILDGTPPEDVLPLDKKTGHFYQAIVDPANPHAVVIDRHAHDIAVGQRFGKADRGLGNVHRYAALAHAYVEAAAQIGEIPSVVQATTWIVQVEAHRWERV